MPQKHLVRLWIALILVATASGLYLTLPNKAIAPQLATPTPKTDNPANPPAKTAIKPTSTKIATTTPPIAAAPDQNTLDVTIEINGQKYPLAVVEKTTAYDAMTKLVADKKITAVFKEFSGLGYFVDAINGVQTDKNAGKYWIYYLNGQPSQMGISTYILKNNDLITWKYEVPQF